MTYPTLTARAADHIAESLATSAEEDQREAHLVLSEGPRFDTSAIDQAALRSQVEWREKEAARKERDERADLYLLEAFMASRVHRTLRDLPVEVLQDFGFWRYLGLFPYRWYMQLREGGPSLIDLKPQDYGGTSVKDEETGKRQEATRIYHLVLRTFLWGKVAYDKREEDPYRRATLVNDTGGAVTDVWHSHIVRIQLGQLGRLPHAFLDSICDAPKANTTQPARDVEKRLTRMKHSVLFDVYDLDEARSLTDRQKQIALGHGR